MTSKKLGDMTPEERSAAIDRAAEKMQAELAANADNIAKVLDDFEADTKPVTTWCQTCGSPVENGKCGCWTQVAAALQQFLGMDFDGSAQMAAEMWDETSTEDRQRVWSAEYANDHDVKTYPDERQFASAEVREQDRRNYPHDDDCPKCGRRQWGGPDPYETCMACGYTGTEETS